MALTTAHENFFRLYGLDIVEKDFVNEERAEENPRHLPRIVHMVMVTKLKVSPHRPHRPYHFVDSVWLRDDKDIDT